MKLLIYGHQGLIGKYTVALLEKTYEVVLGQRRTDDEDNLEEEI
jgi:nucleoside-diphosphate-sugar epimerase